MADAILLTAAILLNYSGQCFTQERLFTQELRFTKELL